MAWVVPRTWTTGELITAAIMNLHVRDNLSYLYSTAILETLLTAKGSLVAASAASTPIELAVGAYGQVLMADSAQAAGVKWGSGTDFLVAQVFS